MYRIILWELWNVNNCIVSFYDIVSLQGSNKGLTSELYKRLTRELQGAHNGICKELYCGSYDM